MKTKLITLFIIILAFLPFTDNPKACTRVVYKGPNQTILTGRSMDFSMPIPANLWSFPRGMKRNGEVGPNSIE